ncbi:hypothetical protein KFK09_027334 [Dendrobium nobile]|uniref:Pre-rRNA-processing protein TSR2 homolog n=1 Tax=Dendrobium nobile TaxID=94219 RepID=A0A8T3AA91_DENNO|nr:hypothetical protein KFK09_027334 [Dendrobium nobile]
MDPGGCVERCSAMSLESMEVLQEGISLVLSQWSALQMAVRHEWGGRDSRRKCDELAGTLLSWFCQSKAPVSIDDLENVLDENLLLSFNTEIVDGSVEEPSNDQIRRVDILNLIYAKKDRGKLKKT